MKANRLALQALLMCACAEAAGQASVTAMGTVDLFAGRLKNSGDAAARNVVNSGGMTTSWFGFKGAEDLGGGLKAEFALTGFFQADTGTSGRFGGDNFLSRDANVGLAGSFGKLQFGRALAPSFLPTVLFNPFGDSFTFSPLVLHAYVPSGPFGARTWAASNAGDSGWSNQVIYSTPSYKGVRANLHYQFGEAAGDSGKNNAAINVMYAHGPLALAAFYQRVQASNPNPGAPILDVTAAPVRYNAINRQTGMWLGGSYDWTAAKVFATWQVNDSDAAGGLTMKDRTASLGVSVPLGQGSVLFDLAETRRSGTLVGTDRSRTTIALGYDYRVSVRTDLYAVYLGDRITGFARESSVGAGIRHRF